MAEGDITYGALNNIQLDIETTEGIKRALAMAGIAGGIDYMELSNILIEVDTVAGKKKAIAVANLSSGGDIPTDPTFDSLKVGDVVGGNYFDVEPDGTWVAKGDATTWDEVSQQAVAQNLDTGSGRIDYDYDELTVDYQNNARYPEEPTGIVSQMQHARESNTEIRPHIHWIQNQAAMPNILIAYRAYNNFEAPPASFTLKALTAAENEGTYPGSGNYQQITSFDLPAAVGESLGLSGTFDCKIYRDSTNASGLFAGADGYSGDWSLKYFDIHYIRNTNGSREEFVK